MDENRFIAMVIDNQKRVEHLEEAMFTKEEKDRLFGDLDYLKVKYDTFSQELTIVNHRLGGLERGMTMVKENLTQLNENMVKVETRLGKVENKLEIV